MFTSSIVQKGIQDKAFLVGVSYSNGSVQFVETLDMTGGDLPTLNQKVASRLATLNATETLIPQVTPGVFVPVTPGQTPLQIFLSSLRTLQSLTNLVTLGVIPDTNSAYQTALANAKSLYNDSFAGQF